jgi:Wzt C-terminal domain
VTYTAHTYPRFEEVAYASTGDSLTFGVGYHANIATEDVVFSLELRDNDGNAFLRTDTEIIGVRFDLPVGPGLVNFVMDDIPLLDGSFTYSVGILSKGGVLYDWREPAGYFEVMSPGKSTGFITLPVRATLHPPEPESIALMAPEELIHLEKPA